MRLLRLFVGIACVASAIAACSSFGSSGGGGATPGPDAESDAPAADAPGSDGAAPVDSGSPCVGAEHLFCVDFDDRSFGAGNVSPGDGLLALDDASSTSPPLALVVDAPPPQLGAGPLFVFDSTEPAKTIDISFAFRRDQYGDEEVASVAGLTLETVPAQVGIGIESSPSNGNLSSGGNWKADSGTLPYHQSDTAALAPPKGTWARVHLHVDNAGSSPSAKLEIDGALQASVALDVGGVPSSFRVTWGNGRSVFAPDAGAHLVTRYDDLVVDVTR